MNDKDLSSLVSFLDRMLEKLNSIPKPPSNNVNIPDSK